MEYQDTKRRGLRIFGLVIICAVIISNTLIHSITNILWLCNISTLLAGVALLLGRQQIALIGATYMILGLFFWLANVLVNHTFGNFSSYITHICFAGAGVFIFRYIPIGRNLWIGCFAWYLLSQAMARIFSQPAENINLAFTIWPGWDRIFSSFFLFWSFTTLSCLGFLFFMNKIIWNLKSK